jgi:hypothetical protein
MGKKRYRSSTLTFQARQYQIMGCREKWLREQRELNKRLKKNG